MFKTIHIKTIADARKYLFFQQDYRPEIGRHRNLYAYRGIPDVNYKLITSLQRTCKDKKQILEHSILNNFAKYAEMENENVTKSVWRKMILGQHHGLPTRLLDWSRSPLMALHFAMTESDMDMIDRRDCVLWRLDVDKLNEYLPEKYRSEVDRRNQKVFTLDMLQSVCADLETYDADMGSGSMVIMEPPTIDMRIANQFSLFSIVPSGVDKVEDILEKCGNGVTRFIIDKNIRWEIRDMLDEANINERVVYPGLDGIATWLGRHYFVRDVSRLEIRVQNLADIEADVIVNPSNTRLREFEGVNSAIFHKAGSAELKRACEQIAPIYPGEIAVTPAFALKAERIYHTAGEYWDAAEPETSASKLSALYRKALNMAKDEDMHSIAFPLLGSGNNGYPARTAWTIALETCRDFMRENRGYPILISICTIHEANKLQGLAVLRHMNGDVDFVDDDYRYIGR